MKWARLMPWIILLAAVQMAALGRLRVLGASPDLLLVAAIGTALYAAPSGRILAIAWAIGLLKELGSAGPAGLETFIFTIAAAAVLAIRRSFYTAQMPTQVVLTGVVAFAASLLYAVQLIAGGSGLGWDDVLIHSLITSIYTALLAPLVLLIWKGVSAGPRPRAIPSGEVGRG